MGSKWAKNPPKTNPERRDVVQQRRDVVQQRRDVVKQRRAATLRRQDALFLQRRDVVLNVATLLQSPVFAPTL